MGLKRLVFCGARGGVGTSTVAIGVARALTVAGHRVALVDLDLAHPSLDMLLGCEDRVVYDLGDLLASRRGAAGVAVEVPGDGGLYLIPGLYRSVRPPTRVELERVITQIENVLGVDVVLVDTSSPSDPSVSAAAPLSDVVAVVMRPDPLGVRSAVSLADRLRAMGCGDIRLLPNLFPTAPPAPDLRDAVDATRCRLLGLVPVDPSPLDRAGSLFATATGNIAVRLTGGAVPLLRGVVPEETRKQILQVV